MDPVRADMELLSNSMAAYAHIKANPESFALYFMMGVSFGLFMALCLLVAAIACRSQRRRRPPPSPDRRHLKESSDEEEEDEEENMFEEDGVESEGKVALGPLSDRSSQSNGTLRSLDVFTSAEELERARRLEERERIVREIWRNGQPDVMVTGTGTIGRVHYR